MARIAIELSRDLEAMLLEAMLSCSGRFNLRLHFRDRVDGRQNSSLYDISDIFDRPLIRIREN